MSTHQPAPYAAVDRPPAAPTEPPKLGFFARLSNVLFSPSEVFADVNRAPKPWAPILALVVVVLLAMFAINWRVKPDYRAIAQAQVDQGLERQGKTMRDLSEDEKKAVDMQLKFSEVIFRFLPIIGAVTTPFMIAFFALLYWLGTLIMQSQATYLKVLSVVAWSWLGTSIVRSLLSILGTFVANIDTTNIESIMQGGIVSNLSPLVSAKTSLMLHVLLQQFDLFNIWILVLCAIGLAAVSRKKTTAQMAVITFGWWGLFVLVRLGWAAITKT